MKVSQDASSFSSDGVADSSFSAKLLETHALKGAEMARCVVDLAQANGRLTVQVSRLQEQLHLARQTSRGSMVNWELEGLTARMTSLEASLQSLQFASQEHDELKQRVVALEQEKSDFLEDLSNLKEECAQLKSELSDVLSKHCESSLAGFKEQVAPRTTQDPVVQPVKQYVWKSSGDVCVSRVRYIELLECPPMTSGVHKWTIFVEDYDTKEEYSKSTVVPQEEQDGVAPKQTEKLEPWDGSGVQTNPVTNTSEEEQPVLLSPPSTTRSTGNNIYPSADGMDIDSNTSGKGSRITAERKPNKKQGNSQKASSMPSKKKKIPKTLKLKPKPRNRKKKKKPKPRKLKKKKKKKLVAKKKKIMAIGASPKTSNGDCHEEESRSQQVTFRHQLQICGGPVDEKP